MKAGCSATAKWWTPAQVGRGKLAGEVEGFGARPRRGGEKFFQFSAIVRFFKNLFIFQLTFVINTLY